MRFSRLELGTWKKAASASSLSARDYPAVVVPATVTPSKGCWQTCKEAAAELLAKLERISSWVSSRSSQAAHPPVILLIKARKPLADISGHSSIADIEAACNRMKMGEVFAV